MIKIDLTVPFTLLAGVDGDSEIVACPVRMTTLTWQTVFDTPPGSVACAILGSLDGVTFDEIDASTVVAGEVRTINTNVPFLKATSDEDVTLLVVAKDL